MRVGKIMIKNPVTVPPEITVLEATKILQELNIRHLPVVRDGQLAGWLSARDLYGVMLAAMLEEITVGEIMNPDPISVTAETSLEEAAHLLKRHKIGGVPVLKGRKLIGVLTVIDLLSAFLFMLESLESSSRLDLALADDQAYEEACRLIRAAGRHHYQCRDGSAPGRWQSDLCFSAGPDGSGADCDGPQGAWGEGGGAGRVGRGPSTYRFSRRR